MFFFFVILGSSLPLPIGFGLFFAIVIFIIYRRYKQNRLRSDATSFWRCINICPQSRPRPSTRSIPEVSNIAPPTINRRNSIIQQSEIDQSEPVDSTAPPSYGMLAAEGSFTNRNTETIPSAPLDTSELPSYDSLVAPTSRGTVPDVVPPVGVMPPSMYASQDGSEALPSYDDAVNMPVISFSVSTSSENVSDRMT